MIVIVDTREQTPFDFGRFPDVETRRDTLPTGDYSLSGFESVIACRTATESASRRNLPEARRFTVSVCLSRGPLRTSATTELLHEGD